MNVVRVPPGNIGLATINKSPVILDTGLHFIVEPTFELVGVKSVNDDLIEIGPVKIIRVCNRVNGADGPAKFICKGSSPFGVLVGDLCQRAELAEISCQIPPPHATADQSYARHRYLHL